MSGRSATDLVAGRCSSCDARRGREQELKVVECCGCGTPWPKSYWTEMAENQTTLQAVEADGGQL